MHKVKNINTLNSLFIPSPISSYHSMYVKKVSVALNYTQNTHTSGRNPLDDGSARRRDLYLATHNTHNRQTSMPSAGFVPAIAASDRPQTHALDRATTGISIFNPTSYKLSIIVQTQFALVSKHIP
jgi:hypothetical protein